MRPDERFAELWTDYLEGELDEGGIAELRELLSADEALVRPAADSYQTHRLLSLVAQGSPESRESFVRETMARIPADGSSFVGGVMSRITPQPGERRAPAQRALVLRWLPGVAAAAVLVVLGAILLRAPEAEPDAAQVTEMVGAVRWTSGDGEVADGLAAGALLSGGTLEALGPESWCTLRFRDTSTVTLSCSGRLTISRLAQKDLRLHMGALSAVVSPQPAGWPMVIHTPEADLHVLGTAFSVEVGPSSTALCVNEGRVRVTRLADGSSAEVPAGHRAVASPDPGSTLKVVPRSAPTAEWRGRLPDGTIHGTWVPSAGGRGRLLATPFLLHRDGEPITLRVAAQSVSRDGNQPVVLEANSAFRIRGSVTSAGTVYFGFSAARVDGQFAGKFIIVCPVPALTDGAGVLDLWFRLTDFQPLALVDGGVLLPGAPESADGLELRDWWCCTREADLGLAVSSVALTVSDAVPPPVSWPVPSNLGGALRAAGFERLLGTWVDAETNGENLRVTYGWRFEDEIMDITTSERTKKIASLMGLNRGTGEVYHIGIDSEGTSSLGTWSFKEGEAVLELGFTTAAGEQGGRRFRHEFVDDDTMLVTIDYPDPVVLTLVRAKSKPP